MKTRIVILPIILLAACSPKLRVATETGLTATTLSQGDMDKGRALYQAKCTQCHAAKNPASKSEEQWRKIIPIMADKAKSRGKKEINAEDQGIILAYLAAVGKNDPK